MYKEIVILIISITFFVWIPLKIHHPTSKCTEILGGVSHCQNIFPKTACLPLTKYQGKCAQRSVVKQKAELYKKKPAKSVLGHAQCRVP